MKAANLFLNLGESFGEVGFCEDKILFAKHFFLPKTALANSVKSFCQEREIKPNKIYFLLNNLNKVLKKRLGTPPAFITTSGFEHWLDMNLEPINSTITLSPQRTRSLLKNDLIFGVSERTDSQGKIIKPIDQNEINFLIEKLKMNKVTHVSIGLLHSDTNSQNEQELEKILSSQGFITNISSQYTNYSKNVVPSEKQRWWATVFNSYVTAALNDFLEDFKEDLGDEYKDLPMEVFTNEGFTDFSQANPLSCFEANIKNINQHITRSTKKKSSITCYWGLDRFLILNSNEASTHLKLEGFGYLAEVIPSLSSLSLQPRQSLDLDVWGLPLWNNDIIDPEPGPMSFSHSLKPCLLDVLIHQNDYKISGELNDGINQKSKIQLEEAFLTLNRPILSGDKIAVNELIEHFWQQALKKLASDIFPIKENYINFAGPLAPVMKKHLEPILENKIIELIDESHIELQALSTGEQ